MENTKVIVITNEKGGVAKTTTSVALASTLNLKFNRKTLLIDCDPQCNTTTNYRVDPNGIATLYDVLFSSIDVNQAVQETPFGDIIPGDPLLKSAEDLFMFSVYKKGVQSGLENMTDDELMEIFAKDIEEQYFTMKNRLAEFVKECDYEYIVMDTNPSLNKLMMNALTCADIVVVPCVLSSYSLEGLSDLSSTLYRIMNSTNPSLSFAGILATDVPVGKTYKEAFEVVEMAAKEIGTKAFINTISHAAIVSEAQGAQVPLISYKNGKKKGSNSKAQQQYEAFILELLGEV